MDSLPKPKINFKAIIYLICFETIATNSRTSTLWKLNSDGTKIVDGDRTTPFQTGGKLTNPEEILFNIIASTERFEGAWVCGSPSRRQLNNTNTRKVTEDLEHELSCGKPVNFTFYDNLVGVMNRENHPPLADPEVVIELIKKYKIKIGKSYDMDLLQVKLRQTKKEKPKSISTFHLLGNYWRLKGDPKRAIECFRKALSVSPHNAEILLNLAKVLFHLQYLDDAIYLTRRSLEVVSSERGAWQQYFTLGEIFKAYGHYQEAKAHFRHVLDLQPHFEPAVKLLKELEEMPLSPWQTYTYFIIGSLVIMVLLFLNNLDGDSDNNRTQKRGSKCCRKSY